MLTPRFQNRTQAGQLLARRLGDYAQRDDAVALALPRGGVPVGAALAQRLGIALDVLVVRKLGTPGHAELAMGAVGPGVRVLLPGAGGAPDIDAAAIETAQAQALAELRRRERLYRGGRAPPQLAGRRVILVDDGVATGATMLAAIEVAHRLRPHTLTLALPVAAPGTLAMLAARVDYLVCLASPARFSAVGQWYERFDQVSDAQVHPLLAAAWRSGPPPPTQLNGELHHDADHGHKP